MRDAIDAVIDVLLPPQCVACDEVLPGGFGFCEACAWEVLDLPTVHCRRCAEPGSFPKQVCERCLSGAPWEKAWAPFEHEGAIAKAIHRFKYEDRSDLSRPLGMLLAARSKEALLKMPGVIVPLPLHEERFRERKFDQAALLATALAQRIGREVRAEWLTRTRHTKRQVGLSEGEREANVRGAFAASSLVRGKDVVVLDDVLTSGATAREAARALTAAGAARVFVLTIARARSDLKSGV